MAHQIKISDKGQLFCSLCGMTDLFREGCKFTAENIKEEDVAIENKKIEIEKQKIIHGEDILFIFNLNLWVSLSLSIIIFIFVELTSTFIVYIIAFILIAVVYLGFDGVNSQISRLIDEM